MAAAGVIVFAIGPWSMNRSGPAVVREQKMAARFARLPIRFERNQGQFDSRVDFLARGAGYVLFLTGGDAVMKLRSSSKNPAQVLRVTLVGANANPEVTGVDRLAGFTNYFVGKDRARWRTGVPNFAGVKYGNVYPGTNLLYHGRANRGLEYDFAFAPGANPASVEMKYSGARRLSIDREGDLVIGLDGGEVIEPRPEVYQSVGGKRRLIRASYVLRGSDRVGFEVAAYDHDRPLLIDPTLLFLTYLGGSGIDSINAIALDSGANVYVAGSTASTDFPVTAGVFQSTFKSVHSANAFVAKMNSKGTALLYSTYLGGSTSDAAYAIAVDSNGNAYVGGRTSSGDFPVTIGAFQTTAASTDFDGFVTELNSTGSALVYSTYLGGTGADSVNGIALDSANDAYLTGTTGSSDFPTTAGSFMDAHVNNATDAFVTKLNSSGTALVYSTYLGGSSQDSGNAIALDSSQNAYIVGSTSSSDFPVTTGVFQAALASTTGSNAFITKLNSAGSALVYSTYLGGSGLDVGNAVSLDASSLDVYVAGSTESSDFPTTAGAFQASIKAAGYSAFVAKIKPDASGLIYSTVIGGSGGGDQAFAIAHDSQGVAYVTGIAASFDFPVTPNAFQGSIAGAVDAFFLALNSTGSEIVYSTFIGGKAADSGNSIALDSANNVYIGGKTSSSNLPTTAGVVQATWGGAGDGFVGEFTAPAGAAGGRIALSTSLVVFPNAGVGESPTRRHVVIENLSMKKHLVGQVGSPAAPFSITAGGGAFNIPPAGTLKVKMLFTPIAYGVAKGSFVITSSDARHPSLTVNLEGRGKPGVPRLSIPALSEPPNPLSMTFGAVGIGVPRTLALKIHNVGLGALGGNVNALSAPFAITVGSGSFGPIAPGGVYTVKVQFAPTAVGLASTTLAINTNNPNPLKATLDVPVRGKGRPGVLTTTLAALNERLGFGGVGINPSTPPAKSFKIKNIGKGVLAGSVGALTAPFNLTLGGGDFTLLPGQTEKVTVEFDPTATGRSVESLVINVTPPGKPAAGITVKVAGKGV